MDPRPPSNPSNSPPPSSFPPYPPPSTTYPPISLHPPPQPPPPTHAFPPRDFRHHYAPPPPHPQQPQPIPPLSVPPPPLNAKKLPSPKLTRPLPHLDPHHALSQPRQPLPPRPDMLASPRGSAVMQAIPKFQRQPLPTRSQIHELPTQNVLPTHNTHDRLQSSYTSMSPIHRDVVTARDSPDMRHDPINKHLHYDIPHPKPISDTRQNTVFQEMRPDVRSQVSAAAAKRRFDDSSLPDPPAPRLLPPMGTVVEPTSADLRVTTGLSAVPMRSNIDMPPPLQAPVVVQRSLIQPQKHLAPMSVAQDSMSQQIPLHRLQTPLDPQMSARQPARADMRSTDDPMMQREKPEPVDVRLDMRMAPNVITQQSDPIAVAHQYGPPSTHPQQKQEWDHKVAQTPQAIVVPDASSASRFSSGTAHAWKGDESAQKTSQVRKQLGTSKMLRSSPNWRKDRYPVGEVHAQPQPQQQQLQQSPPSQPQHPPPSLPQSQPTQPPPPSSHSSGLQQQGGSTHVLPPAIPVVIAQQQLSVQERERTGAQTNQAQAVHRPGGDEEGENPSAGETNLHAKIAAGVRSEGAGKPPEKLSNGTAEVGSTAPQEDGNANVEASNTLLEGKRKNQNDREKQVQSQQPQSSRESSATQPDHGSGSQRRQLKVEDALAYLEKVKIQFAEQLNVYNMFLDIMKEFKAQSIDTTEVIRRVSELFSGHKDLILGFNTFLPPGYHIQVTENKATGVLNTGFVGPEGFSELPPFRSAAVKSAPPKPSGKKTPSVSSPMKKEAKSKTNVKPSQTSSGQIAGSQQSADEFDGEEEEGGALRGAVHSKPVSGNRRITAKIAPSEDVKPEVPGSPQSHLKLESVDDLPSVEKTHEFERAIGFVNTIKERFTDDPATFEQFLAAITHFRDEQKGIREVFEAVAEVFGPHKDLLQQFKEFLPAIAIGTLGEGKTGKRPTTIGNQRRPGVLKAFSQSTPTTKGPAGQLSAKSRYKARDMQFFDDLKTSLGSDKQDLYTDFIKCLRLFTEKIVVREELESLVNGILEHYPEANSMFLQYLDSAFGSGDETMEEGNGSSSMSTDIAQVPVDSAHQAHYLKKTVSEMGVEHGVEKRVSYRLLPPDFPVFEYSGRSALEKKTLNDTWVSGTSGSEDYSFKFMRKNQNEDNLFRCEDDRYELDMLIETTASTIQRLETIVGTISKLPSAEKKRHALAPGALSPINFSTIQRIYGEGHGPEVIDQLRLNPAQTVPVVINRLRKKDAHWRQARLEMNRVWREVGERNFHKSLDHRSPHFKHADKKELSTKSLLSDILEPEVSMAAKDAEMTRARGYPIPSGGGGANHRSGAIKAVLRAAKNVSPDGLKSLKLEFEEVDIHRYVLDWLRHRIFEEMSNENEANRIFTGLKSLIERLFDIRLTESGRCERAKRICNGDGHCAVLFGDDGTYLLFRLYHILFERLMIAMTLAREQIGDRERREEMNREGVKLLEGKSGMREFETKPSSLTKPFGSGPERDHVFSVGPDHDSAEGVFEEFIGLGTQFVRSKLDSGKYEERCRVLLGTDSYCLFTLDKTVAKVVKQVMAGFNGDGRVDETINLFRSAFDRLEKSKKAEGGLTIRDLEEVYLGAVYSHITRVRGPGANVMRFQFVYDEKEECQLFIGVMGKTLEEGNVRGRNAEQIEIEKFVKRTTTGREEYKRRKGNDGREEETKRNGGRDEGRSRKRERGLNCEFVRYVGGEEVRRRRIERMRVWASNELEWTMDGKGKLRALDGTSDYFMNGGRKRKFWAMDVDVQEANRRSVWASAVRKKFKEVKVVLEEKKVGKDVTEMEIDTEGKLEGEGRGKRGVEEKTEEDSPEREGKDEKMKEG